MNCPKCHTQNQADAQFCAQCGTALTGATVPRARRSMGANIGSLIVAGLCVIYLLNPTLGVFELIPDNLPIIGNLDEAMATAGLLWALRGLGLRLPGF